MSTSGGSRGTTFPLTFSGDEAFQPNSIANNALDLHNNASAVNGIQITGTATGVAPLIQCVGADTNISLGIAAKGTGNTSQIQLQPGGIVALAAQSPASGVNYVTAFGAVTGTGPSLTVQGSDTNANLLVQCKGIASVNIGPTGATTQGLAVTGVASQVNGVQITAAATGAGPTIAAIGTDAAINLAVQTAGVASINLGPTGATTQTLAVTGAASQVNGLQITAAATGAGPTIAAFGTDANVPLTINPKGTGTVNIGTATGGNVIIATAPGNLIQIGANTGQNARQFQFLPVASGFNAITFTQAATGVAPSIVASGSDTNIDLIVNSKGTGLVNIGPASASVAISGAAAPALLATTTGGATGPATAAQNAWLAVKINGTVSYVPFWR